MSGDFDDVAGFLEDATRMLKEDEERYFTALREHKKNGTPAPTSSLYDDKVEKLILNIAKKMKVKQPRMSNNPYVLEQLRYEAEEREEAAAATTVSTPVSTSLSPATAPTPAKQPILNALGVTEEDVIRITSRACVVCGRDDRPIEMRKSGIKCKLCRGKPSKKGTRIEVELEVSNIVIKEKAADGSGIINGFKEKKQLGQGAFGKVKLVEHVLQEQHYAMKVLSKKGLTRKVGSREKALELINNEINLMKTIQHHLVCKVISVIHDPDEDKLFIVMEYLARGQVYTLDGQGVGKVPPVPTMKLKKYVLGIARGLQYLHNRNVIHRDIKPENILLDDDDNTKIADFGVSSLCDGGDDAVEGAAGTVPYWPPEMFSSDSRTVRGRAQDVWAFGVTIYAMAVGRLPFRGEWSECKQQITSGQVDYPATMDPQLRDLLQKMLTVDPRLRATIPEVCAHPFVAEIRLSKGFPVEADEVKIAVVHSLAEAEDVPLDTDAVMLCPFPELAPTSQNAGYAELIAFLRGESPGVNRSGGGAVSSPEADGGASSTAMLDGSNNTGHGNVLWPPRDVSHLASTSSPTTDPNGITPSSDPTVLSTCASNVSLPGGMMICDSSTNSSLAGRQLSGTAQQQHPSTSNTTTPTPTTAANTKAIDRPRHYDPLVGPPPIQPLAHGAAQPTCQQFQVIAGKYFVQMYRKGDLPKQQEE